MYCTYVCMYSTYICIILLVCIVFYNELLLCPYVMYKYILAYYDTYISYGIHHSTYHIKLEVGLA